MRDFEMGLFRVIDLGHLLETMPDFYETSGCLTGMNSLQVPSNAITSLQISQEWPRVLPSAPNITGANDTLKEFNIMNLN
jgi:hypothetical protein